MSTTATSRASARWRRKKLEENAAEFRAKEALRIRNHRAQVKEKQRQSQVLRTRLKKGSRAVHVQDETELSDDIDAWLYNAAEDRPRTSHPERSSHFSSTHPTLSSRSLRSSIENPYSDDETLPTCCPSRTITFQDAHKFISDVQKILQEWDRRWGTNATFSHRAAMTLLGNGLVEDSPDRIRREIRSMLRRGREALAKLESIALMDPKLIHDDRFGSFWIDIMRAMGALWERVAEAGAALQFKDCKDLYRCSYCS